MAQKHIIIVAGETSGDIHGANLVRAIKQLAPDVSISGLGGPLMRVAGVDLYEDITNLAVVGFVEVLQHLEEFKRLFNLILKKIKTLQPEAVILIDYPGFNLRLAREIKALGIYTKVIYYISPQVWAWKEDRVQQLKENVNKLLVILPFEKDFYQKHGIDAEFVGHPLLDRVKINRNPEEFLNIIGLSPNSYTITLMPGSRSQEVDNLLPVMLQAAQMLYNENNRFQFILVKAPSVDRRVINDYMQVVRIPLKVVTEDVYDAINASQFCWVASGTATLEIALFQKPMIILYKTSFSTWFMAKFLVKLPMIGLANIVAGKKVVPELIQSDATGPKLLSTMKAIYTDEIKIAEIKLQLKRVRELLGQPGASYRAAEAIVRSL